MTALVKNIHQQLSVHQLHAAVSLTPRGKEIQSRLAKRPSISMAEVQALGSELSGLINELGQADLDAAFRRGDFSTDPPGRTWPPDVFTTDTSSVFGKSLTVALEEIRK